MGGYVRFYASRSLLGMSGLDFLSGFVILRTEDVLGLGQPLH